MEKAVEYIEGDDSVIRDHLGDVYLKFGKREKAREQWERSLALDPSNETITKKIESLKEITQDESNTLPPSTEQKTPSE